MNRTRSLSLAAAALAAVVALLAAGCGGGGSSTKVPKSAVAVVGSDTITRGQFDGLIEQARRSYKAQKRPFPQLGTAEYTALQQQATQFLVQRAEFAQKAKELGINVSDKQVADRLDQIKKQYFGGSEQRYRQQLKTQGLTDAQVRDDVRAQIVSEQLFNKVTKDVKVSDQEVEAYYKQHPQLYAQPQSRDVRHILVKDKATAEKLYAQLKADHGSNFAALAKKYSTDQGSKDLGGRLTVSKGQTVPEFDKVAFSLPTGQIAPPVHSQYGWHVIQALSPIRAAKATPLAEVKESIRQQLLQQKRSEAMTKWVNDVKAQFAKRVRYAQGFAPPSTSTASSATTTG